MYVTHATSMDTESIKIDCSKFTNCENCTNNTVCYWSLVEQYCRITKEPSGSLVIYEEAQCPKFSIAKRSSVKGKFFLYKVKISNDVKGFIQFLSKVNTKVRCFFGTAQFDGIITNNEIVCSVRSLQQNNSKASLYYFHIDILNGTQLKFNTELDNYFTVYNYDCNNIENDNCVTCLWNANDFRYYLKWCSIKNQCTGLNQIFIKQNNTNFSESYAIEDDLQLKCPNIQIRSVEPLFAPWTGGTILKIEVENHWIVIENKTMIITVAGRNCTDPTTTIYDNNTIICIISQEKQNPYLSKGPVEVVYVSTTKFRLISSETFEFVDPKITDVDPVCGSIKDETILTISGQYLDVGNNIDVFIGENLMCELISRNHNNISCQILPNGETTTGMVRVRFDEFMVKSSLFVHFGLDPVIDKGQLFEGIVSGGTAILVRGHQFSCVQNVLFNVYYNSSINHARCQVKNDSLLVCRSPKLNILSTNETLKELKFDFWLYYLDGSIGNISEANFTKFLLYSDPVFTNFEIINNSIVINGHNLYRGYKISDLEVRLQNSAERICTISSVNHKQIKCKPISPFGAIDNLYNITVVIGNNFVTDVKINNRNYNENLITNKSVIQIESIDPLFGLWTGGTTIKIKIKNLIVNEIASLTLTVAGRKCVDLVMLDNETITCITTSVNIVDLSEGPVKILSNNSPLTLNITSLKTFKFVDPEITGFHPVCGPLKGGTKLTVSGNFLNASSTILVTVGENISCDTISHDHNRITCLTEPSDIFTTGRIKVKFDRQLSKYAPNYTSFMYTGNPMLEAGQQFSGIVTGGTTIKVRGYHFSCFENPTFYVEQNGIRYFEGCQVKNSSYMQCRSPKLNLSIFSSETPTILNFGVQTNFADNILDLTPQLTFQSFVLYPDPVFTDFETDNNSIIINGYNLDYGYLIEDMTILLQNSTSNDCQVTLISQHRIECVSSSSDNLFDDDLQVIVIKIGYNFVSNVEKKSTYYFTVLSSITYAAVTCISLLTLFIVALVFCLQSK